MKITMKLLALLLIVFVTAVCIPGNVKAETKAYKTVLTKGKCSLITTQDDTKLMICHRTNGIYRRRNQTTYKAIECSWEVSGFSTIKYMIMEGETDYLINKVSVEYATKDKEVVLIIVNKFRHLRPTVNPYN